MLDLIREGKYQDAILLCNKLLSVNANDHKARYALGLAQLMTGALPESVESLGTVLSNHPRDYKCAANLGTAHMRQGHYQEAIDTFKNALTIQPDYLDGKYNLACAYMEDKQAAQALPIFRELTSAEPKNANYLCSIGDALRELNQWKKSLSLYKKVLALDPEYYRAHLNTGGLLLNFGKYDEALKHCQAAAALKSSDPAAHKNLGDCYIQLELLDEAMEAYADAHDICGESAELCVAIGKTWNETGNSQEASSWFEKAITIDANNTDAKCLLAAILSSNTTPEAGLTILKPLLTEYPDHILLNLTLGEIYWEDGDADAAMLHLQHARTLQPERLNILIKIAAILNSSGDTDGAIELYTESLTQNPRYIPALNGLATSQKGRLNKLQVELILSILENNQHLRGGARASLHNGLAHYYDASKNDKSAAYHMSQANHYQWGYRHKRDWDYSTEKHEKRITRLINTFTPEYFERYGEIGSSSVMPVFIVGMPRSGTTLTEQILARHSRILGIGERPYASQSFNVFSQGFDSDDPRKFLEQLTPETLQDMADQYLERLNNLIKQAKKSGATHVVDKMPDNYALVGWILTLFPNAKIIHANRNVKDVALSCWITQFASIAWASKHEHLIHRIAQYQRIMTHWQSTLGKRIYESSYEDLVANQEQKSREMIAYLGLDWEEQCLSFYESDRLVRTASITQVRQPIYKQSIAKYQRYEPYIPELLGPLNL